MFKRRPPPNARKEKKEEGCHSEDEETIKARILNWKERDVIRRAALKNRDSTGLLLEGAVGGRVLLEQCAVVAQSMDDSENLSNNSKVNSSVSSKAASFVETKQLYEVPEELGGKFTTRDDDHDLPAVWGVGIAEVPLSKKQRLAQAEALEALKLEGLQAAQKTGEDLNNVLQKIVTEQNNSKSRPKRKR